MAKSKYKPIYCKKIIEHMSEGKSVVSFATKIGVARQTLHEWVKVHPDFFVAYNKATDASETWWEDIGRDHVVEKTAHYDKDGNLLKETEKLNPQVWALNMKARFGYREKQEIDVNVSGEVKHTHEIDTKKMKEALALDPAIPAEARRVLEGQIEKEGDPK